MALDVVVDFLILNAVNKVVDIVVRKVTIVSQTIFADEEAEEERKNYRCK